MAPRDAVVRASNSGQRKLAFAGTMPQQLGAACLLQYRRLLSGTPALSSHVIHSVQQE